ncbi:stage II sporulation protein R [Lacrimispora sp. NSJ-141]|uniref:Stage II sporulation protein R n=1 Tax=Lientehia hominis TaxID=2897778 RepID=A0AAP2RJF0_9FIRM|nr:stage II sporulation protein R [Lientehia hominis]MCD2491993.1 stage II sporulation protein R [Lientehia hominis]
MKKERLALTFLLALLCLVSLALWLSASRSVQTVHEDLSSHILRFHVLANSDSEEDQALKLKVKASVLEYLEEALPENAGLEETKTFIESHEGEIHKITSSVISEEGYDYSVSLYLEPWYFPTKSYGDLTFPCGTYEAFRVVIGEGNGKNWWCVLYPSLCFVDATYGVVPEDSKQELKDDLRPDTYASLVDEDEKKAGNEKPEISFRLVEFLSSLF